MEFAVKRSLVAAGPMLVALLISPGLVFAAPPGGTPPGQSNSLQGRVTALEAQVDALMQALAAETAAREAADTALHNAIGAEESARIAGDNNEAAAREAADAALQAGIDVEASARIAGDDNEASLRAEADGFLQLQIDDLESGNALEGFVTVSEETINGLAGPHVIFEGANVHIRSGSGATNDGWEEPTPPPAGTLLGLGNLVVGYNEESIPSADRTGSHNLIVGPQHTYSSFGGFVAGRGNFVTAPGASVSGGVLNAATGKNSSVSGGLQNEAKGPYSSISGGETNHAERWGSSVSGGMSNWATHPHTSVSGGTLNRATYPYSSVGGGAANRAGGLASSVSGGRNNRVECPHCSISGGGDNGLEALPPGEGDWWIGGVWKCTDLVCFINLP